MTRLIKFIHKVLAREAYHPVLTYPLFLMRIMACRLRYRRTITRLRAKVKQGERIKVVFLSMDISKWKCQSLYETMARSTYFDPVIALTLTDEDGNHTPEQIQERNCKSREFYERLGNRVVELCVPQEMRTLSPKDIGADIVFFQVQWGNLKPQRVWDVSKYALPCSMPYGVENTRWAGERSPRFDFHHMADFHLLMWINFAWSPKQAEYMHSAQFAWEWAGKIHGLGHTSLDPYFNLKRDAEPTAVIYAPHFSFAWKDHRPIMFTSTFDQTGKVILDYAKQHSEIKWIFKPHPKLREYVVEVGFMSKTEVDEYYAEWERIAEVGYDGDYAKLFIESRAMVTDCCSFLSEYMPLGKPLIRLIPDAIKVGPVPAAERVFRSFYNCHNLDEMYSAFRLILEQGDDPKAAERIEACREAKLLDNNCAQNIMELFAEQFVKA